MHADIVKDSRVFFALLFGTLQPMPQPVVGRSQCIEVSACPQALAQARVEEAAFDASRLVDFSERPVFEGPATQLTPLVCTLLAPKLATTHKQHARHVTLVPSDTIGRRTSGVSK